MYLINIGIKVLLIGAFAGLTYFVIDYFISLANLNSYLDLNSNALALANLFGVPQALNLYLSIIISGFFVKEIMSYFKS